jgi:hypothetical protein
MGLRGEAILRNGGSYLREGLFVCQRDHGIDAYRLPRRDVTRNCCDNCQDDGNQCEAQRGKQGGSGRVVGGAQVLSARLDP